MSIVAVTQQIVVAIFVNLLFEAVYGISNNCSKLELNKELIRYRVTKEKEIIKWTD